MKDNKESTTNVYCKCRVGLEKVLIYKDPTNVICDEYLKQELWKYFHESREIEITNKEVNFSATKVLFENFIFKLITDERKSDYTTVVITICNEKERPITRIVALFEEKCLINWTDKEVLQATDHVVIKDQKYYTKVNIDFGILNELIVYIVLANIVNNRTRGDFFSRVSQIRAMATKPVKEHEVAKKVGKKEDGDDKKKVEGEEEATDNDDEKPETNDSPEEIVYTAESWKVKGYTRTDGTEVKGYTAYRDPNLIKGKRA